MYEEPILRLAVALLASNIGRQYLFVTNTLAYYDGESVAKKHYFKYCRLNLTFLKDRKKFQLFLISHIQSGN
jgi:hypothetical protein